MRAERQQREWTAGRRRRSPESRLVATKAASAASRPADACGGDILVQNYAYLGTAILLEVAATSALKSSDGFSRLIPSVIAIVLYCVSFYFLSQCLRSMPVGIAYAIWSGFGIVLIALVGLVWFRQALDLPAVLGLALIIAGVVIVNGFSKTVGH
jgi:small multidrug resistance pump